MQQRSPRERLEVLDALCDRGPTDSEARRRSREAALRATGDQCLKLAYIGGADRRRTGGHHRTLRREVKPLVPGLGINECLKVCRVRVDLRHANPISCEREATSARINRPIPKENDALP